MLDIGLPNLNENVPAVQRGLTVGWAKRAKIKPGESAEELGQNVLGQGLPTGMGQASQSLAALPQPHGLCCIRCSLGTG